MTTLPLGLLRTLQQAPPDEAWRALFEWAWETCRPKISIADAANETSRRDSVLAPADLFLATAGWDLWTQYHASAPRTAERLAVWWRGRAPGRAVLILDGLSLREAPWLLHGATDRGYAVHSAEALGAELPADTTPFAQALGFSQRSALENNGGGDMHVLPDARTDSVDLPWRECVDVIDAFTRLGAVAPLARYTAARAQRAGARTDRTRQGNGSGAHQRRLLGARRAADDRPAARRDRRPRICRERSLPRHRGRGAGCAPQGPFQERTICVLRRVAEQMDAAHRRGAR